MVKTRNNGTVWLSIDQMAEVFRSNKSTISHHINNIFEEGDLFRIQLLQIMQQLLLMVKHIRLITMYNAIAKDTICVSIQRQGNIIGTGLGILDRDYVGVYAIHVREDYRKKGLARSLCTCILKEGIKKGAKKAYLQVVDGNDPAFLLYQSLGFQSLYTYWFRVSNGII